MSSLALADAVHDTCSLTVLDAFDVVYVDRVKASRLMTVNIDIGTRFPAYATSTGRVLLAGLPPPDVEAYLQNLHAEPLTPRTTTSVPGLSAEIRRGRRDGYAIADQELDSRRQRRSAQTSTRPTSHDGQPDVSCPGPGLRAFSM